MKHLFVPWKDLNIRSMLIILFLVVSLIPVIVIGTVSLYTSSNEIRETEIKSNSSIINTVEYKLNEVMNEYRINTLRTAYNTSIRKYYDEEDQLSLRESFSLGNEVRSLLMKYYEVNSQNVLSISLVNENGQSLTYSPSSYAAVQEEESPDRKLCTDADIVFFDKWCDAVWHGSEPIIPYVRIIVGQKSQATSAYLVVNIKESTFSDIFDEYKESNDTDFCIVKENGIIQSCSEKSLIGNNIADYVKEKLNSSSDSIVSYTGKFNAKESLISYKYNPQRQLYLMAVTPISKVNSSFATILFLTIFLGLLCILICIFLGLGLSKSITLPLYGLIKRVSSFPNNDSSLAKDATEAPDTNELTVLSNRYGKIIDRLESTIKQNYLIEKSKKDAEMRALTTQINPHFLYNTLETIIWLIENDQKKDAIKMTKQLSSFFRITISKGKKFITIGEEITHINLYIAIQKTRYEDTFNIEYSYPEKLLQYYTPKLVLQPLVENSIYHAIHERKDGNGLIRIVGRIDGDDIILEVWDNGDKVSDQTINEMNDFLHHRRTADVGNGYGIGISNVNDRIETCFGERYGLNFRRENNMTVASIRIRAIEKGDLEENV